MGYPPGAQNDSRAPYNQIKDEFERVKLEVEYEGIYGIYPIIIEYSKTESVITDVTWEFADKVPDEDFNFVKEGVRELIRWNEDKPLTFE